MGITTLRKVEGKKVSKVKLGSMYFFKYLPKEPTSPYDIYPMVFVIRRMSGGFEGVNYHHLLLKRRILLFENMNPYFTDVPLEEDSRLFWKRFRRMIMTVKKLKAAKISIRKYKIQSIRSKLIEINPPEWERTLLLSTELFRNAEGGKIASRSIQRKNERLLKEK